jgi:predicted metal-binding membrane protein
VAPSLAGATHASYRWRDDPFLGWRAGTYLALFLLAALAWGVTKSRTSDMNMSMGPGTVAFFMATWVVMMAAMMFPSVAPMVATYVSIQRGRRAKDMPAPTGASAFFVTGYMVAWSAIGLLCYGLLATGDLLANDSMFWHENGRWLTAVVLAGAAAYELTPAKYACLSRCRGPIGFILNNWRDGRAGALRMGAVQGLWCVGCCWGLMAALISLGMMDLGWMALVALLIAVEKLLPWRRAGTSAVFGTLVLLAVAVAFSPGSVPGLMA